MSTKKSQKLKKKSTDTLNNSKDSTKTKKNIRNKKKCSNAVNHSCVKCNKTLRKNLDNLLNYPTRSHTNPIPGLSNPNLLSVPHTFLVTPEADFNTEDNKDVVKPMTNQNSVSYTPSQLVKLYGLDKNTLPEQRGLGIKVAVIIAYHYPNLQTDFNTYNNNYGLPAQQLEIKNFTNNVNVGWSQECCLDIQSIHTVAPYAQIMVVEAKSASFTDLLTAIQYAVTNGANVISMSWGGSENRSIINRYDNYFNSVNNICFVVSSGDVSNVVNYPSTSPNVISVGGTSITANVDGTRKKEIPWFNNRNSAGGNGYSRFISRPNYQNGISAITRPRRCTPDISLIADPKTGFTVCYRGSYYIFGGTSLAAPVMAGLLAIGNQIRKLNNKPMLSSVVNKSYNLQNFIYKNIYNNNPSPSNTSYTSSTPYTANMYDITVGTNGIYNAGLGYDIASGLGSINANIFCNSLANIN
jgi:subtilase family serine protease